MKFNSKAETLKNLKLKHSKIPKLQVFNCTEYINDKNNIIKIIQKKFKNQKVVVRSSFKDEDTSKKSNFTP